MTRSTLVLVMIGALPSALLAQAPSWRAIAFSPDSRLVAVGAGEPDEPGDLAVWDVAARKRLWGLQAKQGIPALAFSRDSKLLAVGCFDDNCKLFDATTGKPHGILAGHGKAARSVAFSPDGATLAVGSYDNSIRLWNWKGAEVLHTFIGHTGWVYDLAWSSDGRWLASASADKTARIWDVKERKLHRTFAPFPSLVRSLAFGPGDRWLAVGPWNTPIRVYDTANGALLRSFGDLNSDAIDLAPDGKMLAVCTGHQRGVDLFAMNFRTPTDGERKQIEALIAQLDDDATARRDAASAALVALGWSAEARLREALAKSPSAEVRLRARRLLRELRDQPAAVLTGHEEAANCARYSPDGHWLASAGADGQIIFWDAKTHANIFSFNHEEH